jgi:hypothetical protein
MFHWASAAKKTERRVITETPTLWGELEMWSPVVLVLLAVKTGPVVALGELVCAVVVLLPAAVVAAPVVVVVVVLFPVVVVVVVVGEAVVLLAVVVVVVVVAGAVVVPVVLLAVVEVAEVGTFTPKVVLYCMFAFPGRTVRDATIYGASHLQGTAL